MEHDQRKLWRSAAVAFDERHRGVKRPDVHLATPCHDVDVEALIRHVVEVQCRFTTPAVGPHADGRTRRPAVAGRRR